MNRLQRICNAVETLGLSSTVQQHLSDLLLETEFKNKTRLTQADVDKLLTYLNRPSFEIQLEPWILMHLATHFRQTGVDALPYVNFHACLRSTLDKIIQQEPGDSEKLAAKLHDVMFRQPGYDNFEFQILFDNEPVELQYKLFKKATQTLPETVSPSIHIVSCEFEVTRNSAFTFQAGIIRTKKTRQSNVLQETFVTSWKYFWTNI